MILQFLMAWLAARIHRHQDDVIQYLSKGSHILKAMLKGRQIQFTDATAA